MFIVFWFLVFGCVMCFCVCCCCGVGVFCGCGLGIGCGGGMVFFGIGFGLVIGGGRFFSFLDWCRVWWVVDVLDVDSVRLVFIDGLLVVVLVLCLGD